MSSSVEKWEETRSSSGLGNFSNFQSTTNPIFNDKQWPDRIKTFNKKFYLIIESNKILGNWVEVKRYISNSNKPFMNDKIKYEITQIDFIENL